MYSTIDDLAKVLPEAMLIRLTDDDGRGIVDDEKADEALESAAMEIDVYLCNRFSMPIEGTIPPILSKLSSDIAVYHLYSRIKEGVPQNRADRYKIAIKLLERISNGEISIGLQPPPDPVADGGYAGASVALSRDKVFTVDTMGKY